MYQCTDDHRCSERAGTPRIRRHCHCQHGAHQRQVLRHPPTPLAVSERERERDLPGVVETEMGAYQQQAQLQGAQSSVSAQPTALCDARGTHGGGQALEPRVPVVCDPSHIASAQQREWRAAAAR
jgi:hypothetical protein